MRLSRIILCVMCSFIGTLLGYGSDVTIISFSANRHEASVADSIITAIHSKTIHISVVDGNIRKAVAEYENKLDSIKKCSSGNEEYAIIGLGTFGSAAATICAAECSPKFLVLISGVGVNGSEIAKRFFTSSTFFISPEVSLPARKAVLTDIACGGTGGIIPAEFKELLSYQPHQFLRRINCPTFCAFGTADATADWYANSMGMEESLPLSAKNLIRVYPRTGYCLWISDNDSNIPFIGDKKPAASRLNSKAVADVVSWIMSNVECAGE